MKIKTSLLKSALDSMAKIITNNHNIPILTCVRLEAKNNNLVLRVSNLDEHQQELVECDGELEALCVNFNHLRYSIGGDEFLILTKNGETLTLSSGVELSTLPAEDFVSEPDFSKTEMLAVNCEELAKSIERVGWAASDELGRDNIRQIHIIGTPKSLLTEATDSRWLAWNESSLICGDFDFCVPESFWKNFCEHLKRKDATLLRNEKQLVIKEPSGFYTCKILELPFANTKNVKLTDQKMLGKLGIAPLAEVLKLAIQLHSRDVAPALKFFFDEKSLRVVFNNPKLSAKMDKTLPGEFKFKAEICLDAQKVLTALNAVDSPSCDLKFVDELSPFGIESGDLKIIIMPMRMS